MPISLTSGLLPHQAARARPEDGLADLPLREPRLKVADPAGTSSGRDAELNTRAAIGHVAGHTSPRSRPELSLGQRFEQMLWAEMLNHAGLEKAFTASGGQAAAAFSRHIIEVIAEDLAVTHPLGLAIDSLAPTGDADFRS